MLIDSNELIGKTLGSCTLQRLIGRGGMGAVYLARQSRPRRTVAVKVLMPGMAMEQRSRMEFLARFRREADAIAALDHINIMPVYEYGEQEDIAYLVMPYVTGGTLRSVIDKQGILTLSETIRIIDQAAAALDSAHSQNIIHRDLKPGNVLFHADGRLLLADFGLAKVLRDFTDEHDKKQTELTSVGTIVGTPEYLSPEQGTGKNLDYRTDVYSLGVVIYQMLAGRVPFTGSTPVAIALQHALEPPPPLSPLNPEVTPAVEAVVMKTLAKQPEQRYASAGELARALHAAAQESQPVLLLNEQPTLADVQKVEQAPTSPSEDVPDIAQEETIAGAAAEKKTPELELVSLAQEDSESKLQGGLHQQPIALAEVPTSDPLLHTDKTQETPLVQEQPDKRNTKKGEKPQSVEEPALPAAIQRREQAREQKKKSGLQPVGMMLLGSLLTLVIVIGGLGAYTQFFTKKAGNTPTLLTHPSHGTTPTAGATSTPKANLTLPPAMIPTAGILVYGTDQPGTGCDQRGGQWSSTKNAQLTCGHGTTLRDSDTTTLAGTFLDKLPQGKALPSNYVIQVEITVNSGSNGDFGVFVRNQPGEQQQGTYSIMLAPPQTWRAYEYDNSTGASTTLVNGLNTQTPLTGTFTIDVQVQGDTYTLFINKVQEGYAQSGTYTSGGIGLAADAGANINFKNLEIFALK